jgi:hypothetical protein
MLVKSMSDLGSGTLWLYVAFVGFMWLPDVVDFLFFFV